MEVQQSLCINASECVEIYYASVRAGERQHCRTRTAWPQKSGAVVRDFKKHVNPMAEG